MALVEVAKSGINTAQNGRGYIDNLANKFIVKPKTVLGIGGFVFDYEGETNLSLQADITDHYSERNDAIQDHIALRPMRLVMRGFVAELILQKPQGLTGALEILQNKLTTVPAYLGKYTPGAIQGIQKAFTQATNVVNTVDQALARVKNVVGMFDKSAPGKTKQEQAFVKLQALYDTKQTMVVETPYGTFNNMAIEGLTFIQDENTKYWSDITVTLKQLRFVDTQLSTIDFKSSRNAFQSASQVDKGNTKGQPENASIAYQLFGGGN